MTRLLVFDSLAHRLSSSYLGLLRFDSEYGLLGLPSFV